MTTTLAVITGGSRGIGAAIAAAAKESGATVAVCNRTAAPADASHEQLTADLSQPDAWADLAAWYDQLIADHRPDRAVMVHNAATLTPIGPAGTVDPDAYRANVLLNSAAPQVIGDAIIRTALATGTATVLMQLSSGAAKNPWAGWSSYCGAKAAVEQWVRAVGQEHEATGELVRAVAVAPGVVATEMQAEIRASELGQFPDGDRFRTMHAEGALADPVEVGARLWELALAPWWESGAVLDLRDLA